MQLGDAIVAVTALVLALLGIIRHIKADELAAGGADELAVTAADEVAFSGLAPFDEAMLAALEVPGSEPPVSPDVAAMPDLAVPAPECCPATCDPRIMHVLDPWGEDPLWSGRTEALLLWRDNPQGLPLFAFRDPETFDAFGSALNASNFASGMAAGPRFTLFRHTGDQGAIEFNYLRVQSFTATQVLPLTEGGYVENGHGIYCCPSFTPLDQVGGRLGSALQSFELNRRFPTDGRWQWLTGFRWVQWQEDLTLASQMSFFGFVDDYATRTSNDLYGWQVGADSILLGLGTPWRLEGIGKAGVFYNHAAQHSAWATDAPIEPQALALGTSADRVAFVGEVGVTGVYDLTDWLSFRAGYSIFWLGGLATATNQLDAQDICPAAGAPTGAIDTSGSVVVQGITLGLEGRW